MDATKPQCFPLVYGRNTLLASTGRNSAKCWQMFKKKP